MTDENAATSQGASGRGARLIRKVAVVGSLAVGGVLLAMAEGFFAHAGLGCAALVCFAAALLAVFVFAITAVWRRQWSAAIAWLLALLVLAPVLLVGGVVAGFAGRTLGMMEFAKRTLPIPHASLARLAKEGRSLADGLNRVDPEAADKFSPEAVGVFFGPAGREIHFDFMLGDGTGFRGRVGFRQKNGGEWQRDGTSCSGDTATFAENRSRFERALASIGSPDLAWPIEADVEERWVAAANEIAEFLTGADVLESGRLSWRLNSIQMTRAMHQKNADCISIGFNAKRGDQRAAWVTTYWVFDGQHARLEDLSAGVDIGTNSFSGREHGAEVRSMLEPWIASRGGLFRPSHLYQSRGDRTWEACEIVLPDGSALVYRQQLAHAFLAEYHMRVEIRPAGGGAARDFFLPMNTGGRTAILVSTGKTAGGEAAVLLDGGRHFQTAFTLANPRMISPESVLEPIPFGAFTGVKSPLRWASATLPADRELFEETVSYADGLK